MRRTLEAKAETHKAILDKASRLFRERGVEGTSVGDVMAEAGLTHGGFYRHFENKEALVAATLRATFDAIRAELETRASQVGTEAAVRDYFEHYLSDEHLAHPGYGCPVPSLGADVARAGAPLKAEFGAGLRRTMTAMAAGLTGSEDERRRRAIREIAMRVGAIVIARASDAETASEVLAACRQPRQATD